MAFHFPLMPRMFMALAQEDRFPITDILRQTPDIPANCQWALFLRNHDELTLEMVTDRERDYLWQQYAADSRARLNLGIRRRLAPLMERDRRRIELLNSLLLSMPGAPVIYYGDELGMGDNIHLGDRDGVRTPMQWSPDRNGSFSKADPGQLVLPPVMDPLYGYQAVNVEAQTRDKNSQLNWMRRMLSIRKQQKVFGRGSLRLLYPTNRRILAYLREYADGTDANTLLCVANLSRSAQAVELDLSSFVGRVPVEMLGGSTFPPVGQLPYLLTLPPYGFYWFLLAVEAQIPAWHTPAPEPLPDYRTFVIRHSLDELLAQPSRSIFENEVLPAYLPKRRWFGAKDQKVQQVRVAEVTSLPALQPPVLLVQLEVTLAHGSTQRYLLPFGFLPETELNAPLPQQLALARVRRGGRVGIVTDALTLDSFVLRMVELLKAGTEFEIPTGKVCFRPTSKLVALDIPASAEVRRSNLEQSNSSVIIGQQAIIKLFRRPQRGPHPEAEMGRYLTEQGYPHIAALLGEIVQLDHEGTPTVLAVMQTFVFNQGDAWSWSRNALDQAVQTVIALPEDVPFDEQIDVIRRFEAAALRLGQRLGEMHAVLARPSDDEAFAPYQAGPSDCERWAAAVQRQLLGAFEALAAARELPEDLRALAISLLQQREALLERLPELARAGLGSLCTRIHGDLHLGQVLVAGDDVFFIDFEGEPARSLQERRAKSSPLRDVAGLVRSLDYLAASTHGSGGAGQSEEVKARKDAIIDRCHRGAERAFLAAYAEASASLPHQWAAEHDWRTLLDLFLIDKAAYEVCYEAANRPAWFGVPLRGLAALAARLLKKD
jgi:maltose alpha-D-glucosyltransferase/alpha-amylase